jgi:hypothetical protein
VGGRFGAWRGERGTQRKLVIALNRKRRSALIDDFKRLRWY